MKFPCPGAQLEVTTLSWCLEDADEHPRVRAGRCTATQRRDPAGVSPVDLLAEASGSGQILLFSSDF